MSDFSEINKYASDFSRFYILVLLYEGPQHGYNIIKTFNKRLNKNISSGLVYPFLEELEKIGIIRTEEKPVGGKKKKINKLTEEGKKLCEKLFVRFAGLVSTAIDSTTKVCSHCGCKIYEGHTEEFGKEKYLFCCKHCASSYRKHREETGEEPAFIGTSRKKND